MKARIKATGEIVDVDFNAEALANDYPPYSTNEIPSRFFLPEQLEWIAIKEKADPDYWTRLEHQYAGMAMLGILSNPAFPKHSQDGYYKKNVVNNAYEYAHALVEKLKKNGGIV